MRKQGFTLIELLIVIAIIAILAAVLIPNVINARRRANESATQSYARQVATAVESYLAAAPVNTLGDVVAGTLGGATAGPGTAGQQSAECRTVDALNQGGTFAGDLPAAAYPTSVSSCFVYADGTGGYGIAARSTSNTWWGLYNGQFVNLGTGATPSDATPGDGSGAW